MSADKILQDEVNKRLKEISKEIDREILLTRRPYDERTMQGIMDKIRA